MGHVAEIGAEHRVERLGDEFFHVAETLDDAGGALVVDVNDDAEGQQRLVGVLGHEVDAAEAFVVMMALALSGDPVEHEVGGGDEDEFSGISVEGVFAGSEGFFPHAAFAAGDAFAVSETFAGNVRAHGSVIADDHADVTDGDDGLGDDFDGGEPAVDEIRSIGERDILPPRRPPARRKASGSWKLL